MKPVCQLNNNHADIFRHCEKHLSQILCLHFQLISRIRQSSQFGYAIDKKRHFIAKFLADLIFRHNGILHDIVKDSCRNRLFIHLQICKNNRYPQRMNDVGFPRLSELSFMCILSYAICLFNHGNIGGWMVFTYAFNQ